MDQEITINPKTKTHFAVYVLAKKNQRKIKIDLKATSFPNIISLMEKTDLSDLLIEVLHANFANLQCKLDLLEEKAEENSDIFIFLHSNSIFITLLKQNKLEKYSKLLRIYNKEIKNFENEIKEFHELKSVKESSKTLAETETLVLASKNVVTRFPPEPSGYLHLGHAKAALLNNHFARSNQGKLIVRFDDTNPLKENQSFVDCILQDLHKLLDIKEDFLSYTSDYFDELLDYAKILIKEGKAYCDNTEPERMKFERGEGIESKCRNKSIEENINVFENMIKGKDINYCLRAKIDMKNVNKAMRDPVIYRYVKDPHHRTKDKYKIYPTYDFCCPIVDSIEMVTHTLRTNEYRDRNEQYYWFIKNLNLVHKPIIRDFSRLNFANTVLSKRKLKEIVENRGLSWDDPRMPTLRGIEKLGMNFGVLKEYILLQGIGQKTSKVTWDKIWAINKKKLEVECGKFFGVQKDKSVLAIIENFIEVKENKRKELGSFVSKDLLKEVEHLNLNKDVFYFEMLKNAKNEELGVKKVKVSKELILPLEDYKINDEITLMQLGNFIIKEINNDKMTLVFNANGSYKNTKLKVQWITAKNYYDCKMIEYGDLFNENGEFNENSKKEFDFYCEKDIEFVEANNAIQIERVGFYYFDGLSFNLVPYSKQGKKNEK